jgi:hypothetical protein
MNCCQKIWYDCRSSFFIYCSSLVLTLRASNGRCTNSNHQSTITLTDYHTDSTQQHVVRRARLLSEYVHPICTAAVICFCLGLSKFSTGVWDKQPQLRTRLFCPLSSTKFLCHSPATLNLGLESLASWARRTGYFGYTSEFPVLHPWPRFPNCRDILLHHNIVVLLYHVSPPSQDASLYNCMCF